MAYSPTLALDRDSGFPKLTVVRQPETHSSIMAYRTAKKVGLFFLTSGLTLTALFLSAPVSLPLVVTGIGAGITFFLFRASKNVHYKSFNCISLFAFAFFAGCIGGSVFGGVVLGKYTWTTLINFVYKANVIKISLIAGGALTGAGLILHRASKMRINQIAKEVFT